MNNLHFFIIDDNYEIIQLYKMLLVSAGYQVSSTTKSKEAIDKIIKLQPDVVLADLMMPDLDGLELFQALRKTKHIKQPAFIIITSKMYEFDRKRALQLGVNGYLNKPINPKTFVKQLLDIIENKMVVRFWGVRGSLPVSGKENSYYGGNTNCVSLEITDKYFFIFDAGTGIKSLSNYLVKNNLFPLSAKIFITHPHWDHINAIPFFVPFYIKGNEFEIYSPSQDNIEVEELVSHQMDSVYFPVNLAEFSAKINYKTISEESFNINDVHIQTLILKHPGRCLGYRVEYQGKIFCYVTDNEFYMPNSPGYDPFDDERVVRFIHNADILIIDATYSDAEYEKKINWGHSCVSRVVDIADQAQVKLLCLHHHDPDQVDRDIREKLKHAKHLLKLRHSKIRCIAPREGENIVI